MSLLTIAIIIGLLVFMAIAVYFLKKKNAKDAFEQSTLCLQKSLGIVNDAVVIISASEMIQYVNKNAEKLLSCKQRSVLGKNFWGLYSLLDFRTKQRVDYLLDGLTKACEGDFLLVLQNKKKIRTHITIHPIDFSANADVKQSYALVIKDRSEQDSLVLRLNYLEKYDQVTQLPNRRSIEVQLHHALADSRKHGAQHVFCYISLDKTKNISDLAGHSAVEALIVQMAKHLRTFKTTKHDVLARVSSEEFAILYRETYPSLVAKHISRLCKSISELEFIWQETQYPISASIGLLLINAKNASATAPAILSDADIASRIARSQGGNRVSLFKPNDPAVLSRKGNL
ncbi:MAG TPA: diguanylate cyclase, partial [Thiothrix sp.]|nr:diguanylate cyclase [Thiothrix sp.]